VSEQINADSGIGHMIMDARDFLRTDIIVVGLLGVCDPRPRNRRDRASRRDSARWPGGPSILKEGA
jgi:hypothetical protein